MVGGIVIEVANVPDRPDVLYVDCRDRTYSKDTCAIYIENNEISQKIEIGDNIWWQCNYAMWTPSGSIKSKCGVDYDIKINRVGYSGVKYPSR